MPENKKFITKTREQLVDFYLQALEENKIPWEKSWQGSRPENPVSKTTYRGINYMLLDYVSIVKGYDDTRWTTFNQIADKDNKYHPNEKWHLKKGSEGVPIEIAKMIHRETKECIDFSEYERLIEKNPEKVVDYAVMLRTYTVFNYSCIEGVPPIKRMKNHVVSIPALQEFCDESLENMGVSLQHSGDRAFYRPSEDKIVLPEMNMFKTAEDYYATRLHETAHSTGAKSRLNRDLSGGFGSEKYAEEELRAEIASSILFADLHMPSDAKLWDNHKAYIQGWIEILQKNPKVLFKAIKDAEKISDYIQEHAPIAIEKIRQEQIQKESNEKEEGRKDMAGKREGFEEFDERQMEQIDDGFLKGLDVSVYAKPEFNAEQMDEIKNGLENKVDVSVYASPEFDYEQMGKIKRILISNSGKTFSEWQLEEIKAGVKTGVDVSIYAKPEFDHLQMYKIRQGLEEGLDVSFYAKPEFDPDYMEYIREGMEEKRSHAEYIRGKIKDDFLNERISEAEYKCLDEHREWITDKFDEDKHESKEEMDKAYTTLRDALLIHAGFRLIHENQEVLSSDASIMNEDILNMGFEDEGISL